MLGRLSAAWRAKRFLAGLGGAWRGLVGLSRAGRG